MTTIWYETFGVTRALLFVSTLVHFTFRVNDGDITFRVNDEPDRTKNLKFLKAKSSFLLDDDMMSGLKEFDAIKFTNKVSSENFTY